MQVTCSPFVCAQYEFIGIRIRQGIFIHMKWITCQCLWMIVLDVEAFSILFTKQIMPNNNKCIMLCVVYFYFKCIYIYKYIIGTNCMKNCLSIKFHLVFFSKQPCMLKCSISDWRFNCLLQYMANMNGLFLQFCYWLVSIITIFLNLIVKFKKCFMYFNYIWNVA